MSGARETTDSRIAIRFAAVDDVELIFDFIRRLAEYEKLANEVVADEDILRRNLFGERRVAEVVIATWDGQPVFPGMTTL